MRNRAKVACLIILFYNLSAFAQDMEADRRVPDEYETVGGHALATGNIGVASQSGLGAVRMNPSLLALERNYAIGGGYNWPTQGREFYQAGVVDSKSASVAAGFNYTGFMDDYSTDDESFEKDSPVTRRASLGLAQSLGLVAAGIGGQFVEATDTLGQANGSDTEKSTKKVKGTSLNLGISGLLTPTLRFAFSAESLANKKIAEYAPRIFRAGVSLLAGGGDIAVSLDLRQRDRVKQLEHGYGRTDVFGVAKQDDPETEAEDKKYEDPERMAFASLSARVYDMVRLLGAYGQNMGGPERKSLSGGVAVVSGNFSLSYSASRPYMKEPESQQAVNAAFSVNL